MKTAYFAKAVFFASMITIGVAASGQSARASDPSFDCSHVHRAAERAICHDWRLAKMDRRMSYWYGKAMERANYFDDTSRLRHQQKHWIKRRNACGYDRHCLRHKYRSQIRKLRRYATHV